MLVCHPSIAAIFSTLICLTSSYNYTFSEKYVLTISSNTYQQHEALSHCQSTFGTVLASITSNADTAIISNLRTELNATETNCYIGLVSNNSANEWHWLDGTISNYTNWRNESDMNGYCTDLNNDNKWNRVDCNSNNYCWLCNYNRPTTSPTTAPSTAPTIAPSNAPTGIPLETISTTTDDTIESSNNDSNNNNNNSNNSVNAVTNYDNSTKGDSDDDGGNVQLFWEIQIFGNLNMELNLEEATGWFAVIILTLFFSSCCLNCCACIHRRRDLTYDDVKYNSVFVFGLQVFDFYSDVNFCIFLLSNQSVNSNYLYLGGLSLLFIVVPWLYNILFLLYLQHINWMGNVHTANWNRRHRKKLVLATMLSGGIYYSVQLLNSRLFGLRGLDMGLSHRQILYISQRTVIVTALLENLPQIIVQILFLLDDGAVFDVSLMMALISSSVAFVLAVIASIMNILDDLHDETIMLEILAECKSVKLRKMVQKRFRLRRKIRLAIAETMGNEDYGTIQLDSLVLTIAVERVICQITISVHHFSTAVEIQSNTKSGYSKPVMQLIRHCQDGILSTYLETFLIPPGYDKQDVTFAVRVDERRSTIKLPPSMKVNSVSNNNLTKEQSQSHSYGSQKSHSNGSHHSHLSHLSHHSHHSHHSHNSHGSYGGAVGQTNTTIHQVSFGPSVENSLSRNTSQQQQQQQQVGLQYGMQLMQQMQQQQHSPQINGQQIPHTQSMPAMINTYSTNSINGGNHSAHSSMHGSSAIIQQQHSLNQIASNSSHSLHNSQNPPLTLEAQLPSESFNNKHRSAPDIHNGGNNGNNNNNNGFVASKLNMNQSSYENTNPYYYEPKTHKVKSTDVYNAPSSIDQLYLEGADIDDTNEIEQKRNEIASQSPKSMNSEDLYNNDKNAFNFNHRETIGSAGTAIGITMDAGHMGHEIEGARKAPNGVDFNLPPMPKVDMASVHAHVSVRHDESSDSSTEESEEDDDEDN